MYNNKLSIPMTVCTTNTETHEPLHVEHWMHAFESQSEQLMNAPKAHTQLKGNAMELPVHHDECSNISKNTNSGQGTAMGGAYW